jgi:hypothetical protein
MPLQAFSNFLCGGNLNEVYKSPIRCAKCSSSVSPRQKGPGQGNNAPKIIFAGFLNADGDLCKFRDLSVFTLLDVFKIERARDKRNDRPQRARRRSETEGKAWREISY